ncbi:unnamed protein product [Moneuplotes crassus]|uniref:Protein kinase domain-containing protein n=1 Tax=Euplotes crassus TaxID=5936 RepID=A0AAD1Y8H1_EUPCR|nr:unnamed protein product [Moneuplotes crassus]
MKKIDGLYLTEEIGKGSFGTVYICKIRDQNLLQKSVLSEVYKETLRKGKKIVCKVINRRTINPLMSKSLGREIETMMKIKHPNVLAFLEVKKTKNNVYIFLELCNGGDLTRLLKLKRGSLDENQVKIIIKKIAEGLNHLNQKGIVHRDLKLDNILLNFPGYKKHWNTSDRYISKYQIQEGCDLEVVIGDLGFARPLQAKELAETFCGTPLNMAPEIINGIKYDSKVDIWSLGTLMFELLVGRPPFSADNCKELKKQVNNGQYTIPDRIKLSPECLDLIDKLLKFSPEERISHQEILTHDFFTDEIDTESFDPMETVTNMVSKLGPSEKSDIFKWKNQGLKKEKKTSTKNTSNKGLKKIKEEVKRLDLDDSCEVQDYCDDLHSSDSDQFVVMEDSIQDDQLQEKDSMDDQDMANLTFIQTHKIEYSAVSNMNNMAIIQRHESNGDKGICLERTLVSKDLEDFSPIVMEDDLEILKKDSCEPNNSWNDEAVKISSNLPKQPDVSIPNNNSESQTKDEEISRSNDSCSQSPKEVDQMGLEIIENYQCKNEIEENGKNLSSQISDGFEYINSSKSYSDSSDFKENLYDIPEDFEFSSEAEEIEENDNFQRNNLIKNTEEPELDLDGSFEIAHMHDIVIYETLSQDKWEIYNPTPGLPIKSDET